MSTAPASLPHRDAILEALEAAGLTVGRGVTPKADDIPASGAYAVLYMAPGVSVSESLADERTDWSGWFQVTCVGPTDEIALWVADRARQALHAPLTVPGRLVWRAEPDPPPPLERDDDVTPPLYYIPLQFTLRSTTA